MFPFNVRVYGILINENGEVLLSDEEAEHTSFTKFPGGGLEYGEGLLDALKREYVEECDLEVDVVKHIYTTDFFEKSSFNDSQIISIYYQVQNKTSIDLTISKERFEFINPAYCSDNKKQAFRWVKIQDVQLEELTFDTDKIAWKQFLDLQ